MDISKKYLSIWYVIDAQDGEFAFAGSFKQLKEFTLEKYALMNDDKDYEKMKKKINKGDEVDYFKLLEDMDYQVNEICSVTKDDFND